MEGWLWLELGTCYPKPEENGAERGWETQWLQGSSRPVAPFCMGPGDLDRGVGCSDCPLYLCCLIQHISCLHFELFEARIVGRGKINGDTQTEGQIMA